MPSLDVSFMVSDPMFADTFAIKRRTQTVTDKGRASNAEATINNLVGTVTQREPSDLERQADGDRVRNRISVFTTTPVYSALTAQAPDVIVWNGMDYLVEEALPYSRFGGGVYEVKATSMTSPAAAQ